MSAVGAPAARACEAMSGDEAPMLQRVIDALLGLEQQTALRAPHKRTAPS